MDTELRGSVAETEASVIGKSLLAVAEIADELLSSVTEVVAAKAEAMPGARELVELTAAVPERPSKPRSCATAFGDVSRETGRRRGDGAEVGFRDPLVRLCLLSVRGLRNRPSIGAGGRRARHRGIDVDASGLPADDQTPPRPVPKPDSR
ncbi:hypothetical protein [Amycolatopsis lurida]|uniref:hypothetical protein n=1 Tax=Amycolatopsis lurida TaxID=31959 RepID=UPI000AF065D0|nr:hypothetical protein [Amycolatopsis lurida]